MYQELIICLLYIYIIREGNREGKMEKYRNNKNNKNKIENIFVEKLENYNKIQSLNRSI